MFPHVSIEEALNGANPFSYPDDPEEVRVSAELVRGMFPDFIRECARRSTDDLSAKYDTIFVFQGNPEKDIVCSLFEGEDELKAKLIADNLDYEVDVSEYEVITPAKINELIFEKIVERITDNFISKYMIAGMNIGRDRFDAAQEN